MLVAGFHRVDYNIVSTVYMNLVSVQMMLSVSRGLIETIISSSIYGEGPSVQSFVDIQENEVK